MVHFYRRINRGYGPNCLHNVSSLWLGLFFLLALFTDLPAGFQFDFHLLTFALKASSPSFSDKSKDQRKVTFKGNVFCQLSVSFNNIQANLAVPNQPHSQALPKMLLGLFPNYKRPILQANFAVLSESNFYALPSHMTF